MKRRTSVLYILLFMLVISLKSYGQEGELWKHRISVYGSGVFSSLEYESKQHQEDSWTNPGGGSLGIGYSYHWNEHWGIGTGLAYQHYKGYLFLEKVRDRYKAEDLESDSFEFGYDAGGYLEQQKAGYLYIPVELRYETKGEIGFYAVGGARIGIPLKSSYRLLINELQTWGYYPQWEVTLYDPAFMGYGYREHIRVEEGVIDLKTDIALSIEAGIKQELGYRSAIYIGGYVSMGISDIQKQKSIDQPLIEYRRDSPSDFNYHSLMESREQIGGQAYVSGIKTLSYGVKISYRIGLKK